MKAYIKVSLFGLIAAKIVLAVTPEKILEVVQGVSPALLQGSQRSSGVFFIKPNTSQIVNFNLKKLTVQNRIRLPKTKSGRKTYKKGQIEAHESIIAAAEQPGLSILATISKSGILHFWNENDDSLIKSTQISHLARQGASLEPTDMLITRNNLLLLSTKDPVFNLFFTQITSKELIPAPRMIENDLNRSITRLREVSLAPMFLTLSGGPFLRTRVIRWSSTYPPIKLMEYTSLDYAFDVDAVWEAEKMASASLDQKLAIYRLKTDLKIEERTGSASRRDILRGISMIPRVNYLISVYQSSVKIWSLEGLELIKTISEDGIGLLSGPVYHKDLQMLAIVSNRSSLVLVKFCEIEHCQACLNSLRCHTCSVGYGVTESGLCGEYGTSSYPIKWSMRFLDTDRTKLRIYFLNTAGELFRTISAIDNPYEFLNVYLRLPGGEIDKTSKLVDFSFMVNQEVYAWDLRLKYELSLPRNSILYFYLKNGSDISRRVLSQKSENMGGKYSRNHRIGLKEYRMPTGPRLQGPKPRKSGNLAHDLFFEKGPQSARMTATPATSLPINLIYNIIGVIYRAIYWLCLGMMVLDIFWRYLHKRSLNSIRLLTYVVKYFGVSLIALINVNNRAIVDESNVGLHEIIFGDKWNFDPNLRLDPPSTSRASGFILYSAKIADYGTSLLLVDRLFFQILIYFFLLILSIFPCTKRTRALFKALRLIFAISFSLNFVLSSFYQIFSFFNLEKFSFYTYLNLAVALILITVVSLELANLVLSAVLENSSIVQRNKRRAYRDYKREELVRKTSEKRQQRQQDTAGRAVNGILTAGEHQKPSYGSSSLFSAKAVLAEQRDRAINGVDLGTGKKRLPPAFNQPAANDTPRFKMQKQKIKLHKLGSKGKKTIFGAKAQKKNAMEKSLPKTFMIQASLFFSRLSQSFLVLKKPRNDKNGGKDPKKAASPPSRVSYKPNADPLSFSQICFEFNTSYTSKALNEPNTLFNLLSILRWTFLAYIVVFMPSYPFLQSILFFLTCLLSTIFTALSCKKLDFALFYTISEMILLIWSVFLIALAYDDEEYCLEIPMVWFATFWILVGRMFVLGFEAFLAVLGIKYALGKVFCGKGSGVMTESDVQALVVQEKGVRYTQGGDGAVGVMRGVGLPCEAIIGKHMDNNVRNGSKRERMEYHGSKYHQNSRMREIGETHGLGDIQSPRRQRMVNGRGKRSMGTAKNHEITFRVDSLDKDSR